MWGIGVLTWNDPTTCCRTVDALRLGLSLNADDEIVVFDNGSDVPFTAPQRSVRVIRQPTNLGAGGGLSALVRHLLAMGADHLLVLEDDWRLERSFALSAFEPLLADMTVGQIRLGARPTHPGVRYYTYGLEGPDAEAAAAYAKQPLIEYAYGFAQRLRSLWSNNPFVCRREVAERFLLTGQDELRMARPYYASGLWTLSTTPGHFWHIGSIRERREKAGWRK